MSLFSQNELSHFCGQSESILGILCMHLLLQFYADCFETLLMFRSWSVEVHIVWIMDIILKLFLALFTQNEISHFCGQSE